MEQQNQDLENHNSSRRVWTWIGLSVLVTAIMVGWSVNRWQSGQCVEATKAIERKTLEQFGRNSIEQKLNDWDYCKTTGCGSSLSIVQVRDKYKYDIEAIAGDNEGGVAKCVGSEELCITFEVAKEKISETKKIIPASLEGFKVEIRESQNLQVLE